MSSAEQQRTVKTSAKAPSPVSRSSSTSIRPGSGALPSRTLDRTTRDRDRAPNSLQQRQASGVTLRNGGEQLASLSELSSLYEAREAEAKAHTAVMNDRIKQNRQTWMTLKQENKELQALMAERGGAALQAEGKHPVEKQLEQLEMKVHELRRQHDKVMQEKKTTISKLQYRQDSLEHVSRGTGVTGPGAPVGAGMCTREAREMRQLENRLDKAVLKANEAQSIRHTYEQVLHQLQQDQLAFDPCVKALETALKTKTAEQQQALLEQREAQRQKEAAKHELSTVEERVAAERLERQARLQAQRAAVRTLGEANSALLARQMQGAASVGVALGGKVTGAGLAAASLPEGAQQPLVTTPQEAVAALLAAVPSCRLHTLCDHLLAQQETLHSLTEMKHAAVHKVSECSTQLAAAQAVIAELDSGGRARSTQTALDSAQARLAQANAQAEAAKSSHDLVMKAYVDVRAGIEHLASMLAPLPLPPGHIPVPMSDDTLGDVLAQCQQRLVASLAFIHTLPKAAALLDSMMQNPELSFGGGGGPADDGM